MAVYKHVLIATDLSEENHAVVEKGLSLAKDFGAEVSLLHVVEPLPGYGYTYVGIADIEVELRSDAIKKMQQVAEKYGLAAERCHTENGPFKLEMTELVRRENIDCLIIGSHGRHGVSEMLGSAAHAAVHSAPCDVITVRIKKRS